MNAESADGRWRAVAYVLLVILVHLSFPALASSQQQEGASSQESQQEAASSQEPQQHVRVPTKHANVHMGPSSGQQVLVLVPKDTVLPVVGRRGEWVQVQLSPKLRETGMVMRWYKNEDKGWMHESTVEFVEEKTP